MKKQFQVIIILIFFSNASFSEEKNYLVRKSDTLRILNEMKPEIETDALGDINNGVNSTTYWRIINDSLFSVKSISDDQPENINNIEYKRFYNTFSSTIFCPYGKHWFENKELKLYEKEKAFIFENGILKSTKILVNPPSILSDYAISTDSLYEFIKREIDYSKIPELISTKQILLQITDINTEGIIKDIEVLRGNGKELNDELIRVLKSIPKWNVIYQHGLKTGYYSFIRLDFEKIKNTNR